VLQRSIALRMLFLAGGMACDFARFRSIDTNNQTPVNTERFIGQDREA
jgi:hypothetical protein